MKFLAALLLTCVLSGCMQTTYRAYDPGSPATGESLVGRSVEFQVKDAYYRRAPSCIVIAPLNGQVEEALERHFSGNFDRIVGPRERESAARRMALDPADPGDLRAMARNLGCHGVLEARFIGGDGVYAVFWSQAQVGLELTLNGLKEGELMWRARHVAARSDGGLPLNMFSAISGAVSAARLKGDADVAASVLDDALRRMVRTLPNLRYTGGKSTSFQRET